MSKPKWKQECEEFCGINVPVSRVAGFGLSKDGKSVFISAFDEEVILILNNKTDLMRCRSMIDLALRERGELLCQ
jgi:predicted YcjX-like family ATPase